MPTPRPWFVEQQGCMMNSHRPEDLERKLGLPDVLQNGAKAKYKQTTTTTTEVLQVVEFYNSTN
jgi:hypothetical protein